MDKTDELLKKYWGYTAFLPYQKEIINSVIDGRDTLAIMATGGGKSLCYQLPALYLGGLTVVISPLISLMKDQVDDLNARGIPAAAYNSSLEHRERGQIETDVKNGNLRLLFVSPEKCMQPNFLLFLKESPVRLIAIDEAHCISEWGHNFRPEYRQLSALKKQFPEIPVIALTATAIPEVRKDIREQLGLHSANEFIGSFNRTNLQYRVIPKKNQQPAILQYLAQHKNESGIIYCFSKRETEDLAEELRKRGYNALAYHAGLSKPVREKVQDAFIHDNVPIVCATVAFGMGIDKPDVRFVIHYDLPKTVESYYQETGRCGRDGQPGECILFYSRTDYHKVRYMIERDDAAERHVRLAIQKLQDIIEYCETTTCRRKHLLAYFGEAYDRNNCGSCDNCNNPTAMIDGTNTAKTIVRCVKELPTNFGIELIAEVLTGAKSAKIKSHNLDRIPTYNSGKQYSKPQYRTWINELVRQGYLARSGDKYPVICLTTKSDELLTGGATAMLPVPEHGVPKSSKEAEIVVLRPEDAELFVRLKTLRKSIADRDGVPPYVIFPNKSLWEMARVCPCDEEQFRTIAGVGEYKMKKYGADFISAIKNGS